MRKVNSPGTRQIVSTLLFNSPPNAQTLGEESIDFDDGDNDGDLELSMKKNGPKLVR